MGVAPALFLASSPKQVFKSRLIKLLTSAVGAQPPRLDRDENRRISHGTTNDQICLTTNNFFRKTRMITTTE